MNNKNLTVYAFIISSLIFLSAPFDNNCIKAADKDDLTTIRNEIQHYVDHNLPNYKSDIALLKSKIDMLKKEQKTIGLELNRLKSDKTTNEENLNALTKQQDAIEARISTLNETISIKTQINGTGSSIKKELSVMYELAKRKDNIAVETTLIPSEQLESLQNEGNLLKANIEANQAVANEKETALSTLQKLTDATNIKAKKENLALNEELEESIGPRPLTKDKANFMQQKRKSLNAQIKLLEDELSLESDREELARLEFMLAKAEELNVRTALDVNTKIVAKLSERIKEEEDKQKKVEAEKAISLKKHRRHVAKEQKAKVELEKEEALKQAKIATIKQLKEKSPERKRVLEAETEIHKHKGFVATLKDELITQDMERYNSYSEFERLKTEIEEILGSKNTPSEIEAEVSIINTKINNTQKIIEAIQGILSATAKQRSIVDDNLKTFRSELLPVPPSRKSIIEKEAEKFSDKSLAKQLITLENQNFKLINEQKRLLDAKFARLTERAETAKKSLKKLVSAKERLAQIKAANVWIRQENKISSQTIKTAISDIKLIKKSGYDIYNDAIDNLILLSLYISDTKNLPTFLTRLFIILALIVSSYFSRRYLKNFVNRRLQNRTIPTLDTPTASKIVPGLFHITKNILTMVFLFIISVVIALTVPSDAPVVRSAIYGFAIFTIYKFIKGFVVESLSPYIGFRRWTTIAYFYTRNIYRGLCAILFFSAVMMTIISVLNIYNYESDVIELLRFIFRIVTVFIMIWLVASQRSALLKMIPYADDSTERFVNKVINIFYPFLIIFIISLGALRNLGYVQMSYTLFVTSMKVIIAAVIAYLVYLFISKRLIRSYKRRLGQEKASQPTDYDTEEKTTDVRLKIYKRLSLGISLVGFIIVTFSIWNNTFRYVLGSPEAPDIFKHIYAQILYVLDLIKQFMGYDYAVSEGKYTSPYKILIGIFVLVVAFIGTRYLKDLLTKTTFKKRRWDIGVQHAILSGMKYVVIGIAAIIGLNIAGIPLKNLSIFAGAFGIGIGFGMQNIINNLVSGIIILFERPIKIDDIIRLDSDIGGTVEKISIRSTVVKAFDRTRWIIPNSSILEGNVVNWSHGGDEILRTKVEVGVAYGSDTDLVRKCLLNVANEHPEVLKVPQPLVRFAAFGDSALNFELYFWGQIKTRWYTISELNFTIDKIFRENNIEIAFPQRDLHIRSSIPMETKFAKNSGKDGDKHY